MAKSSVVPNKLWIAITETRLGNHLGVTFNKTTGLLIVDLADKNSEGGNEVIRMMLDEPALLRHTKVGKRGHVVDRKKVPSLEELRQANISLKAELTRTKNALDEANAKLAQRAKRAARKPGPAHDHDPRTCVLCNPPAPAVPEPPTEVANVTG